METPSPAMLKALRQAHLYAGGYVERNHRLYVPGDGTAICTKAFAARIVRARLALCRRQGLSADGRGQAVHLAVPAQEARFEPKPVSRASSVGYRTESACTNRVWCGDAAVASRNSKPDAAAPAALLQRLRLACDAKKRTGGP